MQGVPSRHPPGAVCFASGELTRYGLSMQCLQALQTPPHSALHWNMGCLVAHNLNNALTTTLANPMLQWAWIMGDDHTYAPDLLLRQLDRMFDENLDVLLPLCLNRMPPLDPVIIERDKLRMKPLGDLPPGGLYTLKDNETCGDAGLLMRRNVLEACAPDFYDRPKSGGYAAEDQQFVSKIKSLGFAVHVDLDLPLGHMGTVDYVAVNRNGEWKVRLTSGQRHVADLQPLRPDDP